MIRPLSAKASGALLGRPPSPIVRIKQAKPAHQTKSEPAAGRIFEASSFIVVLSDLAGPRATGAEYETCRFKAFDLSNLAGPGVGGGSGRAHARRPPLSLRDISPAPRGNLPQTPAGSSFSERQKRKQKIVQGDCCPLENPLLGSALAAPHAGRPLLSLRDISPALRGNRPLPHGRGTVRCDQTR